jgi:hypothetical protein
MLFRTLPVAPGCNNVAENEKTSGNRYKQSEIIQADTTKTSVDAFVAGWQPPGFGTASERRQSLSF